MTIRSCLAKTIPASLFSALIALAAAGAPARKPAPKKPAAPKAVGELAALVSSYRSAPTPVHRAAVEKYAAAHAKDKDGPLARLALGVVAYENRDYRAAIAALKAAAIPQLADYSGYYLAASRVESNDNAGIGKDAAAAHAGGIPSPLSGKAWLVEARSLKTAAGPTGSAPPGRPVRAPE